LRLFLALAWERFQALCGVLAHRSSKRLVTVGFG
jgi:hypothetical protein